MQPSLPLPTDVRIAGCVLRHFLWHSWQKNLCLPDRQASIVRLSCGTSRLHRVQRNVAGGLLEKIDEKIDFITMMPNSNPNTTAASVSLSNVAILEYNSEAKSHVMAEVISLILVLECDCVSNTSAFLFCRLDAGGEEFDEFGSPSRSSASLSEGWWEQVLVGEGAARARFEISFKLRCGCLVTNSNSGINCPWSEL